MRFSNEFLVSKDDEKGPRLCCERLFELICLGPIRIDSKQLANLFRIKQPKASYHAAIQFLE